MKTYFSLIKNHKYRTKMVTGIMAVLMGLSLSGCSKDEKKQETVTEISTSSEAESLTESSEKDAPDSSILHC